LLRPARRDAHVGHRPASPERPVEPLPAGALGGLGTDRVRPGGRFVLQTNVKGRRRRDLAGGARTVHLWPQLERVLRHYMFGPNRPRGELLFPSYRRGKEHRL